MICANCGKALEENAVVCPACGCAVSPLGTAPVQVIAQPAAAVVAPTNVKQFAKTLGDPKIAKEINTCSILLYVCAGLTLLLSFVAGTFPLSLIDVAVLAGLGIWMHTSYTRIPAILALCYSVFGLVLSLIQNGTPTGYLIVLICVFAVIYTFKAKKQYDAYLNGEYVPASAVAASVVPAAAGPVVAAPAAAAPEAATAPVEAPDTTSAE